MIEIFLKAKHWQIFLITVAIPFGIQMAFMMFIIDSITQNPNPDFELIFAYFKYFPILILLLLAIMGAWIWSLAIGVQRAIPANIKLNIGRFKLFFFIPSIYILFFLSFFVNLMDSFSQFQRDPNIQPFLMLESIFPFIFVLNSLSMFCILYCLIFVAKTIKTAELQRTVGFGEYIGVLFSILFYPLGVWSIQPNVNKIALGNKNSSDDDTIFPVLDSDNF